MFKLDQISAVLPDYHRIAFSDRLRYQELYRIVERYVSEVNSGQGGTRILLGGTMGIKLLLGNDLEHDDMIYQFYTSRPLIHGNDLTNAIAEQLPPTTFTAMFKTEVAYRKYRIIVNGRHMVEFYYFPEEMLVRGRFSSVITIHKIQLPILPPELYIIDSYRTLYSPGEVAEWPITLEVEELLYQYWRRELHKQKQSKERRERHEGRAKDHGKKHDRHHGRWEQFGGEESTYRTYDEFTTISQLHLKRKQENPNEEPTELSKNTEITWTPPEVRKQAQRAILDGFVGKDRILVGEFAYMLLTEKPTPINIIEIITPFPLLEEEKVLRELIAARVGTRVEISMNSRPQMVMQDFRMYRLGVRVADKEVAYIYNSANYEVIPTIPVDDGTRIWHIGGAFVILRFIVVAVWMVKFIHARGTIEESYANFRIDTLLRSLIRMRKLISTEEGGINPELFNNQLSPLCIFDSRDANYIGGYRMEQVAIKMAGVGKKHYSDYFPYEYHRDNGKFRIISDQESEE